MELQNSSAAAQSRPQTWQSGVQNSVTGRPSKDHEPYTYKMELQNFICGRPSQDHKPGNLQYENSVTGRPSKNHEPDTMEPQDFDRSRSDHKPYNLEFQFFTCGRQPPQTLQNGVPKFYFFELSCARHYNSGSH